MAIKLGATGINTVKLGTTDIQKIYIGSVLAFDNTAPAPSEITVNFQATYNGGTDPADWNTFAGVPALDEVLVADMLDDTGSATGITLTSLVAFNGALGEDVADGEYYGWPEAVWDQVWYIASTTTGNVLELSGLSVGEDYTIRLAGTNRNDINRKITFDTTASTNGPLEYVPNASASPTQWVELVGTVPGDGIVNISISGMSTWGYVTGMELIVGNDAPAPVVPIISGTFNIPDAVAGDNFNVDVSSLRTGGDPATGWQLTGTPPTNAVISSVGLITGVAVEETLGNDTYGVRASNAQGYSNTLTDADGIDITGLVVPVISGTFNIPNGTAGAQFNTNVSSLWTSGGEPTDWELTGTPPTNAVISSAGLITGTLTVETVGNDAYGVRASNAAGNSVATLTDADGFVGTASGDGPPIDADFIPPDAEIGVYYFYNLGTVFSGPIQTLTMTGTLPDGLSFDDTGFMIEGSPTTVQTLSGIYLTATDFESDVTNSSTADIAVTTGTAGSFTNESGFTLSGVVEHDGLITIAAASGLGTKPQAAAKGFDEFNRYSNNGTVENQQARNKDGDTLTFDSTTPFTSAAGTWIASATDAYGQQSLVYNSSPEEAYIDRFMDGWRGWLANPGSSPHFYQRWMFWVNERPSIDFPLVNALSSGATQLEAQYTIFGGAGSGDGADVIITLNDGSYHRTTQDGPKVTDNIINFNDPVPEAVNAGNTFYYFIIPPTKMARIWDTPDGIDQNNLIQSSFTWLILSSAGTNDDDFLSSHPLRGQWNLMELELYQPTLQVDDADGYGKAWINGELVVTTDPNFGISGAGGTWPFTGFYPRGVGNDSSRPDSWSLPDNAVRLAQLYVDDTTQRIEISDSNVSLEASGNRSVCLTTVWTDTSITFKLNKGEFTSLSGKYIWHIDDNNSATLIGQIS